MELSSLFQEIYVQVTMGPSHQCLWIVMLSSHDDMESNDVILENIVKVNMWESKSHMEKSKGEFKSHGDMKGHSSCYKRSLIIQRK